MVAIKGYFDASMDKVGVSAVAGLVGSEEAWRPVEDRWREALGYWQIPRFHFFDVLRGMGQEKGEICIRNFCKAVGPASGLHMRTSVMDNRDWAILPKTSEYSQVLPQSQHACLFNLFDNLVLLRREFVGDEINLVFDSDYGSELQALAVYEAWKEHSGDAGFDSVAVERRMIGLEVADLAANLARLEGLPTKDGWLGLGGKWGQHSNDLSGGTSAGVMWSNWISDQAKEAIERHLRRV